MHVAKKLSIRIDDGLPRPVLLSRSTSQISSKFLSCSDSPSASSSQNTTTAQSSHSPHRPPIRRPTEYGQHLSRAFQTPLAMTSSHSREHQNHLLGHPCDNFETPKVEHVSVALCRDALELTIDGQVSKAQVLLRRALLNAPESLMTWDLLSRCMDLSLQSGDLATVLKSTVSLAHALEQTYATTSQQLWHELVDRFDRIHYGYDLTLRIRTSLQRVTDVRVNCEVELLLHRANSALSTKDFQDAKSLAYRAFQMDPYSTAAFAILCCPDDQAVAHELYDDAFKV